MSRSITFVALWLAAVAFVLGVAWSGVQVVDDTLADPVPPPQIASDAVERSPTAAADGLDAGAELAAGEIEWRGVEARDAEGRAVEDGGAELPTTGVASGDGVVGPADDADDRAHDDPASPSAAPDPVGSTSAPPAGSGEDPVATTPVSNDPISSVTTGRSTTTTRATTTPPTTIRSTTTRPTTPPTTAATTTTRPPTTVAPTTTTTTTTTSATSTTVAVAEPELVTFSLTGGTAVISFSPSTVRLVSAVANPGFDVSVEPESPGIKVEFRADHHRSRVDAWWADGPRSDIREKPR